MSWVGGSFRNRLKVHNLVRGVCAWNALEWNGLEDAEKAGERREKEWTRRNQAKKKLLRISLSQDKETAEKVGASREGGRECE